MLHLIFLEIAKMEGLKKVLAGMRTQVTRDEDGERAVKNLIDADGSHCYVWDALKCHVVACDFDGTNKINLVPTDTPLFNVTALKACGKWLVLAGPKGVNVMQIPSKWSADEEEVICRVLPVGDRFYSTHSRVRVLQADWHPQPGSSHLVILSDDNNLRLFDMESEHKGRFPDQTIALADNAATSQACFFVHGFSKEINIPMGLII